ncbi:MAG: hypothetical protein JKY52_08270 [Flavobacteriales bacterium]|nr:hypothetical protein [Flavobacteriales bacterium]
MKGFWDAITIPFRTRHMGKYGMFTLKKVIDWHIKDPLLKTVLNVQCGDHGLPPGKASFPVHCAVMEHYFKGGFYPMGGGGAIVKAMTNKIKELGSEVRTSQNVTRILLEGDKKKNERLQNAKRNIGAFLTSRLSSNYGFFTHGFTIRNVSITKYRGGSINFKAGVNIAPTPVEAGFSQDLDAGYSWQTNVNSNNDPDKSNDLPAYGYMYSDQAPISGSGMMDYYTEKLNPYDKQDKFLGIPFSNADNYMVSGEGLGGGFRLYNRKAGHFFPNAVSSSMTTVNIGAEVEIGLDVGGGGNLGVGFQRLTSGNWDANIISGTSFIGTGDEPYFFRFNNDPSGIVGFGNDNREQAKILYKSGIKGDKKFIPNISHITTSMNGGKRSKRSSYIAYHTNDEMLKTVSGISAPIPYMKYARDLEIDKNIDRSSVLNGVGEFAIFNEGGMRYVYGLPVYSRNEINLRYDMDGVSGTNIDNNYLAYKDISDMKNIKSKVGEERNAPYATSYLLTEITTPDYVDRTMDGPTADDFGGYTRFSYQRYFGGDDKTGSTSAWYRWRIPYTGLLYDRGELSTEQDDMGSVTAGEKEIYYLDTIETKTHYAVFFVSDRMDAYGADDNNTAAQDRSAQGLEILKRLDKIELYSKNNGTPKLIKTVRFDYLYSLAKNLPNSSGPTTGKLTLTRVWFEYNGIYNARISPYNFEYEYPSTSYPAKYATLDNYGTGLTENPNYSAFDIDPWGNYQTSGGTRFDNLQDWVNQQSNPTFDPAAWQLKVIKLPTQGEIHIQYEQDDYAFIQDKQALGMVSLTSNPVDDKYYLNLADIGLSNISSDKRVLAQKIHAMYGGGKKKIYFKFLYALIGNNTQLTRCTSEYISGYCSVKKAGWDGNGVYVILGSDKYKGKHDLPRKVCWDYVKTQRQGNLNLSGNCDADAVGVGTGNDVKQIAGQLVGFLGTKLIPSNGELCKAVNLALSYLRVPLVNAKKGGGIRVRRLLMYDQGMESGDEMLYGSEYTYTTEDPLGSGRTISSGVATNEPVREESALVEFDEKYKQSFLGKVVAGRDKEQAEKPLGESILPGPSVGYSKVTINNIHNGITNTGFAVKEYFTARDFPTEVFSTTIETQKDFMPLPALYLNLFINNLWMSQGFVFKQNNMHGQPKRDATYAGNPADIASARLSTLQEFTYFKPGEKIPVMGSLNAIDLASPGKETEVIFEIRGVEDISNNIALEFDLDVGIWGFIPLPYFSVMPSYTRNVSKMFTHVTTKVVRYPAIQKSVTTYADGIFHTSENLAFNLQTGKPVLRRTTDGYSGLNLQLSSQHDGAYLSYSFPADRQYKNMGQKAKNERKKLTSNPSIVQIDKIYNSTTKEHSLQFTAAPGGSVCDAMACLYPGDLIKLTQSGGSSDYGVYHVSDSIVGSSLYILPNAAFVENVLGNNSQVTVEVLRSGRTNQLNTTVGSFTTYGDTTTFNNVDADEIARRQKFADRLDSVMHSSYNGNLGTALIPAELSSTIAASGNCRVMSTSLDTALAIDLVDGCGDDLTFEMFITDNSGTRIDSCCFDKGGHFDIDEETQELVYYSASNQCHGVPICIDFCPDPITTINVVHADAQLFDDKWTYDSNIYAKVVNSNAYENGSRGKWRLSSNYAYLDTIKGAIDANERTYKSAGTFGLQLFNWNDTSKNDDTRWLRLRTVTQYSPNGNTLEEQDIQGIYSTAKFGYDHTTPYLVANNTDYQSVQFDGFEKIFKGDTELEDGWAPAGVNLSTMRDTNRAHSGKSSIKIVSTVGGDFFLPCKPFKVTQQMLDQGVVMKFWINDTSAAPMASLINVQYSGIGGTITKTFDKIARTGEWALYQAVSTDLDTKFSLGDEINMNIVNASAAISPNTIWIDDYRFQPLDAQMVTYVYDTNTRRLIASFDDQHFGLFYVYNAEGKLMRKLIETERGIKTITETLFNTPTVER